jgi:formate dehydrogenase major subunit
VRARTRRGEVRVRCSVSTDSAPGSCFLPFHFREAAANLLTIDALDPYGKIPEFKFCAVRVDRLVASTASNDGWIPATPRNH